MGLFAGQGSFFLHPQSVLLFTFVAGLRSLNWTCGPVTTGRASSGAWVLHGQAAIAEVKEHVAIPTAIAAATVSF